MAQKFRKNSLVQVTGSPYPVLIVKNYDTTSELYTCSAGTNVSSYKVVVREAQMRQCPEGTVAPKPIAAAKV